MVLVDENYRGWVVVRYFSNLLQNICRLFDFLAKFSFTSQTELDYDHHKLNVRVASQVAERIKNENLRKLQENPWKPWIWWQALNRPTKSLILTLLVKSRKKSDVKYSIEFHRIFYLTSSICLQRFVQYCFVQNSTEGLAKLFPCGVSSAEIRWSFCISSIGFVCI